MIPHMNGLLFSLRKKIKMADSKKSKWPTQKTSLSSAANSHYFFMEFLWIGLVLVKLIDVKGIGVVQVIWS